MHASTRRYANPYEVQVVRWLIDAGLNNCQISRATGISVTTVRGWRHRRGDWPERRLASGRLIGASCPRCHERELDEDAYAYLLGMYLGDGYIVRGRRGVYLFSIAQDVRYPGIIKECAEGIARVRGANCPVGIHSRPGCVAISATWKHWPCIFPQHRPGPKHLRSIELADWQARIVADRPHRFLRGLIHSDGWRGPNRVTVRGKRYSYPRYQFTNESDQIRSLFSRACDVYGIRWRRMNRKTISVARADDVQKLDLVVGCKY